MNIGNAIAIDRRTDRPRPWDAAPPRTEIVLLAAPGARLDFLATWTAAHGIEVAECAPLDLAGDELQLPSAAMLTTSLDVGRVRDVVCWDSSRPDEPRGASHERRRDFMERMLVRMSAAQRDNDARRAALVDAVTRLAANEKLGPRIACGALRLHAWFHLAESGLVQRYDGDGHWAPSGRLELAGRAGA